MCVHHRVRRNGQPPHFHAFRIGFAADFHLRKGTFDLGQRLPQLHAADAFGRDHAGCIGGVKGQRGQE